MSAVKERILGAITVMTDADAAAVWNFITDQFSNHSWDNIEEIEPDEWDRQMLNDIRRNRVHLSAFGICRKSFSLRLASAISAAASALRRSSSASCLPPLFLSFSSCSSACLPCSSVSE